MSIYVHHHLVAPPPPDARHPRCRPGFTFIELCLGLVVTAMVLGAVASLSLAMGQAWRRSSELESLALRARQSGVRIAEEVRNGKLLCTYRPGALDGSSVAATNAAILIWKADTNGDNLIQGAELTLIEHDPAARRLLITPAGQGDAVQALSWAVVSNPAVISDFKQGRNSLPLAHGVSGALFAVNSINSTTVQPTFEFALRFVQNDGPVGKDPFVRDEPYTEYGTCAVRAPLQKPS